jgi:hypothetical protein
VGSEAYVVATKSTLGIKGQGREVIGSDGSYELRESPSSYTIIFEHENSALRLQNSYIWDNSSRKSGG